MKGDQEDRKMKAIAQRSAEGAFTHRVDIRQHELLADEPADHGGDDAGPSPQELLAASLASCTAVTMEMYAKRKGWDVGPVEVVCEYTPAERGCPTNFKLLMRVPRGCSEEQVEALRVIAAKCPIHRTLDGEVSFDERVELVAPAEIAGQDGAAPSSHDESRATSAGVAARKLADRAERLITGGTSRRRG
jgi:putative redox protein